MSQPALVSTRASLDSVRVALIGLGAIAQDRRTVVLDIDEYLLLLDHDDSDGVTTIALGGPAPQGMARWLADQLEDLGFSVGIVPASGVPTV